VALGREQRPCTLFLRREKKIIRGLAKPDPIRYFFHARSACAMDRGYE